MNMYFLLKGIIIGFSVAMPVGPIGILCIQRTLQQGTLYGIIFGLGVATADAIYGALAAFSVSIVFNFLLMHQFIIRLLGGIFLIYLGSKIILKETLLSEIPTVKKTNLINDFTSSILYTLTNPLTILIFAAIFSWQKLNLHIAEISSVSSFLLILGIFIGSCTWFTTLSILVGLLRNKFSKNHLKLINYLSGFIIILFGIFALLSLII